MLTFNLSRKLRTSALIAKSASADPFIPNLGAGALSRLNLIPLHNCGLGDNVPGAQSAPADPLVADLGTRALSGHKVVVWGWRCHSKGGKQGGGNQSELHC